MAEAAVKLGTSTRRACVAICGCLAIARGAMAFPAADPLNPSVVPTPSETPQPTESDLQHQLQLQSGFGAPGGAGWTFTPSASLSELLTDNVLQSATNRRWDLVTLLGPGLGVIGDLPNMQVKLNWSPQLRIFARDPHETGVNQQLVGTGNFTIVPEAFYVDLRALSTTGAAGGGFGALGPGGGLGGIGSFGGGTSAPGSIGALGLSKENQTQNTSLSITPYYMHRFGDVGTAKVGIQYNQSSFSSSGSFLPLFLVSSGTGQYKRTLEELAQFETGEFIFPWRDEIIADVSQTNGTGVSRNSSQDFLIDRLGYSVRQWISVFGELGAEKLTFSGVPPRRIDDGVWTIGFTLTPNPDSKITLGYGHKQGATGFQADAHYTLTPRTTISARYTSGVESDLQQISSQLDLAALDQSGNAVDSQTGAPLFIGNSSGFGVSSSLSNAKHLTITLNTILDRDQFSVVATLTQRTTLANAPSGTPVSPFAPPVTPVGSTSTGQTLFASWTHQLTEALNSRTSVSSSSNTFPGTGTIRSVGGNAMLQYLLSETVSLNARYAYFKRYSPQPGQNIYQNLVLVGITKRF